MDFRPDTGYRIIRQMNCRIRISGRISGGGRIPDIRPDIYDFYKTLKIFFSRYGVPAKDPVGRNLCHSFNATLVELSSKQSLETLWFDSNDHYKQSLAIINFVFNRVFVKKIASKIVSIPNDRIFRGHTVPTAILTKNGDFSITTINTCTEY